MNLEQRINYQLNKFTGVKKCVKRLYQLVFYGLSRKIRSEGNIVRISPDDPNHEYFFGYYDKSPWCASMRYVLCMRADNTWREPDPVVSADIILIDTEETLPMEKDYEIIGGKRIRKIATTHSWNVQQGCMAQWLGPDFNSHILYNDIRRGKACSVILDVNTGEERVLPMPCYTVSSDGKTALTLDFSRLHNLRPGYGYAGVSEITEGIALPDTTAIWKLDIEKGNVTELLKYTDFARFQPRQEMLDANSVHKVNHLMLSPNGKRFMVLYRWFCGQRKYTRLITCNVDGSDMYLLSDDDMVSHCCWKNDEEIMAFERKRNDGPGFYLMKDRTQKWTHIWPQLSNDGHPSYCPVNNSVVLFDTYPSRSRIQEIKTGLDTDTFGMSVKVLAKVFSPFKYDNCTRCDLHPRWRQDGCAICFDGAFENHRGLYVVTFD